MLGWLELPLGIGIIVMALVTAPIWNIAGAVIIVIIMMIVIFVIHIYRKDAPREIGNRTVELDGKGIALFIEKERIWDVSWDAIPEVRFRQGDRIQSQYYSGRDPELVMTDGQKKECVLSEFDDLEDKTLRELFSALQERLKGQHVQFGSARDPALQNNR